MTTCIRLAPALLAAILLAGPAAAAEPAVPDLAGSWSWRSEGAMLVRGNTHATTVHRDPSSAIAEGELTFPKQEGRVLKGTVRSKNGTEPVACVIGLDGRTLACSDADGFWDGRIVDADTVEYVYRHVTKTSSVVAAGVLRRKR